MRRRAAGGLRPLVLAVVGLVMAGCSHANSETGRLPLRVVSDLALPGDTSRFDYASLDVGRHRLFVAHLGASEVVVVDTSGPGVRSVVPNLAGVHGVLVLPGLGRVLATETGTNQVVILDEDSGAVLARAPTGRYPDGLAFDPVDNRAFVSNEVGASLTVVDPTTGTVLGTVELGAEVGNVVYDSASGRVLAAVQGHDEVVVVDPRTLAVSGRRRLAGCDRPHGLAVMGRQVFVACEGNARLFVLDADSGAVQNRLSVGSGPDVLVGDPGLARLYVMAESGVVTAVALRDGSVSLLARRKLGPDAHSAAVDPGTHLLYVPLQAVGGRPVLRVLVAS